MTDELNKYVEAALKEMTEKGARFQDAANRRILLLEEEVERLKGVSPTNEVAALTAHVNELALISAELATQVEKTLARPTGGSDLGATPSGSAQLLGVAYHSHFAQGFHVV